MTMHITHPSLNTYSKKKGKQKFRNAEEAKKARDAEALQNKIYSQWGITKTKESKRPMKEFVPNYSHRSSDTKIDSVEFSGGSCTRKTDKVYTGTLIKGIAQTHKSNAVPVIDEQHMIDIARMRR